MQSTSNLPELFQDAFLEHRPRLAAFLTNRIDPKLRHRLDVEDILSETFQLGQKKWDEYRADPKLTIYVWLYRLAMDSLIAAYRHEKRDKRDFAREEAIPEESSMLMGMKLIAQDKSPSSEVAAREMGARVLQFLNMLKDDEREVLHLRYLDGLSFAEIGEQLGLTENAASVRCFRAVKQLKSLVGPSTI